MRDERVCVCVAKKDVISGDWCVCVCVGGGGGYMARTRHVF